MRDGSAPQPSGASPAHNRRRHGSKGSASKHADGPAADGAASAAGGHVAPPPAQPQPQTKEELSQQKFAKGDEVLYVQRDGTLAEAKVVAVDMSVLPFSYGIEIEGHYRETEATRLMPARLKRLESA